MAFAAPTPAEIRDGMTAAQREAVLADNQVLAVIAGAGAGKTGVLTARVARRCEDGTATAGRTLVCTFSRKAADELRTRLWRLGVSGVRAGTVHRLALRVVADWREHRSDPPPVVLGDRRRALEAALAANPVRLLTAALLDAEIGWAKATMVAPEGYEAEVGAARRVLRVPAGLVAERYAAYEDDRRRRSLLDLDDLLLEAAAAIEGSDGFGTAVRWRHRHVMVDEMQDLSPAQFRLIRVVVGDDPDLFVVGDPSQSVYGWNGADPGLMDELGRLFPGIRVIRLEENHRCAPAIVRLGDGRARTGRPAAPEHAARGAPPGPRRRPPRRRGRGPLGRPPGMAGPPARTALVPDRGPRPDQRAARDGRSGARRPADPGGGGRRRSRPGQRPRAPHRGRHARGRGR